MRIIHLLQSPRFSGAENVVCQIIGLFKNDSEYEMMYCSRDGQIREALIERDIPFIPIDDICVDEVKRVIKEYKPDVIHAHDMRASFVVARASHGTPVISHIHNNSFDSRSLSLKSLAYLYAAFKSKHIFWVSDSSFNGYAFHELLSNKSEILYNIINIEALYKKMKLDSKNYDYDIVYLGRLSQPKNPARLLTVLRKVVDKNQNVRIAVVGTGELERNVHEEADRLGLDHNIDFLGFVNNPYKILHDAKLMIMTSLWEGTPMCVLEAMSLGVPVVSTPTDGVKVVVESGETGYLSDNDNELADFCCRLLSDSRLRATQSVNAKNRARTLMDIDDYKKKISQAYILCNK